MRFLEEKCRFRLKSALDLEIKFQGQIEYLRFEAEFETFSDSIPFFPLLSVIKPVIHFIRSARGPLQAADIPQQSSLKSICPSLFTSKAKNNLKIIRNKLNWLPIFLKSPLTLRRRNGAPEGTPGTLCSLYRGDLWATSSAAPKNTFPARRCLAPPGVWPLPTSGRTWGSPLPSSKKRRGSTVTYKNHVGKPNKLNMKNTHHLDKIVASLLYCIQALKWSKPTLSCPKPKRDTIVLSKARLGLFEGSQGRVPSVWIAAWNSLRIICVPESLQ